MSGPEPGPPSAPPEIPVLHLDEHLVIVHKPAGLLFHRSPIDAGERRFLLQTVRNQIGARVFPVHRLDKPTSGIVALALSSEVARRMAESWNTSAVRKQYLAFVRGHPDTYADVEWPLRDQPDAYSHRRTLESRPARTTVRRVARIEIATPVGRYDTGRYSLVACEPHSGRRHQIRRHLKHLRHPIIGDANYGDGPHNRLFRDTFGLPGLMLAATRLRLPHPVTAEVMEFSDPIGGAFANLLQWAKWPTIEIRFRDPRRSPQRGSVVAQGPG